MRLAVRGTEVTLSQGPFFAKGTKEDNVYSLKGQFQDQEFRFRLYTLGDKYVFHRETWRNGKIQQVDISYLERKK